MMKPMADRFGGGSHAQDHDDCTSELFEKANQGDIEALNDYLSIPRIASRRLGICRHWIFDDDGFYLGRSKGDDDLRQETDIKTFRDWRKVAPFRGESEFFAWYSWRARNTLIDEWRKTKDESEKPHESIDDHFKVKYTAPSQTDDDFVKEWLSSLPAEQEVVVRMWLTWFSLREIARELDCAHETVRRRLKLAFASYQACIGRQRPEPAKRMRKNAGQTD